MGRHRSTAPTGRGVAILAAAKVMTQRQVAEKFGITPQAVSFLCRKYGVEALPAETIVGGLAEKISALGSELTVKDVAVALSVSISSVRSAVRRHGLTLAARKSATSSRWEKLAARFRYHPSGCWIWRGCKNPAGYGVFSAHSRRGGPKQTGTALAHRLVYEELIGKIPTPLCIDHLCRTTDCVNPYHMEPVTLGENVRRGISWERNRAQRTHCIRGHDLLVVGRGNFCRECDNARHQKWRAKKAANAAAAGVAK